MNWQPSIPSGSRVAAAVVIGMAVLLVMCLALVPMAAVSGGGMFVAGGTDCPGSGGGTAAQPTVSKTARTSIPANYLADFKQSGGRYGVPWAVLAGIGEVESNDGRSTLPGVHSAANAFGAAGPMQIGIGGAAGNTWGGAPIHAAAQRVSGVATDGDGDGVANVYDPADAIAGAAKYLVAHGVQGNVSAAIFAYNHLESYVQSVLFWAGLYSAGGFLVSQVNAVSAPNCLTAAQQLHVPNQTIATIIAFARSQIGKPYLWGGTGPDAFDCSGLVMMAYRAAGISIPRTSQDQFAWGPKVQASQVEPGDLVFFAGSDGTVAAPGHVGLVIGKGMMVEAYATGFPIRIASYGTFSAAPGDFTPVGFTRPWAHAGVTLPHPPPAA
jgi:cell wall-associated NlpC family hydrolase